MRNPKGTFLKYCNYCKGSTIKKYFRIYGSKKVNAGNVKSDLRYGKTRNKRQANCPATLLQNEWNSDVALFTTNIN